jgi:hypothetical protein
MGRAATFIMKKLLFLWILSVMDLITIGQGTEYFNKILSSVPGTSTIRTIVKADSGYFLELDNILPGQTIGHNQFMMINTQGVIIDSVSYPDNYKFTAVFPGNTALRTNSGKYLVATSRIDNANAGYCVLVCMDANLDTLWTRTFTHPDTLAAAQPGAYVYLVQTAIRQTWDGGFIIAGNYSKNCNQNQMRSYLLKTDSMGVMQWIKKYDNVPSVFALRVAPDSGYIFPTVFNGYLSVVKTDPLGNIQWNVKVNSNSNPSFPMDLAFQDDTNLVVVSSYWFDLVYNKRAITVARVNCITQTKVFEKNYYLYHNYKCHSLHQSVTLETLKDKSFVVASTSQLANPFSDNPHKGVMMKLTPNGDSVWARYYSYGAFTDFGQFERMILTDDGGFLAVGYYLPYPPPAGTGSRPWIVKMDSLGCDTPGCHLISIEERVLSMKELEMFPNPFSDIMHVVLPEEFFGGMLVMYDVQGRRAVEIIVPEGYAQESFTVQTGHLTPGVYLVELTGKDERVWRRKAVRR